MQRRFFWHPSRRKTRITKQPAARPRFEWVGARRYLADTPYALPKDPQEVRRLDFQHFMLRHELHGNYLAPLDRPRGILDLGCGTGRWAMEMAAEFPRARVVGMDLVLPDSAASLGHGLARQPGNVAWIEGDFLQGLPFADASFDFVYLRFLLFAVPERAWPTLLDELIRVTRPGGWIESVESWVNLSPAFPASATFADWVNALLRQRGCDPQIAHTMPALLRARGLEQIATRELAHKPPVSPRWRQIYSTLGLTALENLRTPITAEGIVATERYDQVAARARQESERSSALMWPAYITYGQRPASLHAASSPPRSGLAEKYERLFGRDDWDTGKTGPQDAEPGQNADQQRGALGMLVEGLVRGDTGPVVLRRWMAQLHEPSFPSHLSLASCQRWLFQPEGRARFSLSSSTRAGQRRMGAASCRWGARHRIERLRHYQRRRTSQAMAKPQALRISSSAPSTVLESSAPKDGPAAGCDEVPAPALWLWVVGVAPGVFCVRTGASALGSVLGVRGVGVEELPG